MSRRLVPVLWACLAASILGTFGFGQVSASAFFVVPAAGLGVLAYARRRPAQVEAVWTPTPPPPAVHRDPGSPRAVARALARVECRELMISPWTGVGLGLLLVTYVALVVVYSDDSGDVWTEMVALSTWFAHPLAGMMIVAAHRSTTRPERDGTAELFESCPTAPSTRTVALLGTAVAPLALYAVFFAVFLASIAVRSPAIHGPLSWHDVPVLPAGPVLVAGAVALGVALGSWVRFALTPVVAVVAIGMVSIKLATAGDPSWNGVAALSTIGPSADSPLAQPLLPTGQNLAWLVELVALVAVVAVLRHRRDAGVWLGGAALVALATATAVLAVAPVDEAEARGVAAAVANPVAHQNCDAAVPGRVEVCTYEGYGEMADRVAEAVAPVGRALPAGVPKITLRQGPGASLDSFPPSVRRLVGVPPDRPADEIAMDFSASPGDLQEQRLRLAFAALGADLPRSSGAPPTSIEGQARGVVALWLAARGLDRQAALRTVRVADAEDTFEAGLAWPTMCGPVVWSSQDLTAAQILLWLPEARVRRVVHAGFRRWADPATGTDELLAELGLAGQGPYDQINTRRESFC